ncbi:MULTISPECIES: hypothetical protein [Leuconostoc]|jgi:hypothetical protein|uniref:hypothetical protein n=1 Tax=Leuconostoc TaxID=1243 RepID=UPI00166DAF94|nr:MULTISPECIES: hypothetical protein [Leuconostoc]MBK0041661.1 hypothetical protein [Leuconostoc sp. S51]MBK0052578.1 hypothetical protein [Leuconostoc sp. S50]MBS0958919.1 hypothetical protein [Leuconostoc pseudomesenteroides]MCT4380409.1 hypothetical protein [Leuconostoc pseudomesenteroides]MDN2452074.1 hypothetical protein [Leuconostoc sp. UCMA20149]
MKEVIDDVVVCFNGTNANKELENKISLLNVPYKRTRNKLIVDYGFVIVNIHFLTKNSNFDAFHFKHIKISEMLSTEGRPEDIFKVLKMLQSGRFIFENYQNKKIPPGGVVWRERHKVASSFFVNAEIKNF